MKITVSHGLFPTQFSNVATYVFPCLPDTFHIKQDEKVVQYRGKLWWVQTSENNYKNTFGDINFGEFECLCY